MSLGPGTWWRMAGLTALPVTLVAAAAYVLTAQFAGAPATIAADSESPAYIADVFGGNTVGQSFRASHDGLCRIDLRLRPVKGECRVTFRLWAEGQEEELLGSGFPCPHDESTWYSLRFPPVASSRDAAFRWEVGLAEPASDAVVSLEATTADTRPDGTLYVNGQATGSDVVFLPYYCNAGTAPPLLADWLEQNRVQFVAWLDQEHDTLSADHLLILVALAAAAFAVLLVLPAREQPPKVRFLAHAASFLRMSKHRGAILPIATATLVSACAIGGILPLIAQARMWAWPAAYLGSIEPASPKHAEGPWVAYDFVANLTAAGTTIDSPEGWYVKPGWLALGPDRRPVLHAHPPSLVHYTVKVPAEARLHAAATLDPAVWLPERGDGVLFIVRTIVDGVEETVYYQEVDPKNNPEDRRWHDFDVDLSPYAGQTITLLFITYPAGTNEWDWAAWGMPLLLIPSEPGETER